MDKLTNWVQRVLVGKMNRITNFRYFKAIKYGFFAIMPLTIIGSIFMLITDFPVPGYSEWMSGIFGEGWVDYISPAYRATFNIMGLVFAGTMSYKLAEQYEMDKLTSLVLGIVSYIVVIPKTVLSESGEIVNRVMPFEWTGTKGVIAALIMSVISVEITRFCIRKKIVIKMPEGVPPMISNAFSALIPGFLIVLIALILNGIGVKVSGSFPELIYSVIQAPLQGLIGSPIAIVIVAGLNGLAWWFGIHPTVVNSMLYPILYANAEANQALADIGNLTLQTGNIGTVQMLDQIGTIGGSGLTIGFVLSLLLVSRSSRMKAMLKVSFIPSLFNINEPIIFGVPVMFNPLFLIPMTLAPVVAVIITYVSIAIGFMPMFVGRQAPWAMPPIFSGIVVSGWQCAVTQVVVILVATLIYYPFVKVLDQQYYNEENAGNQGA